MHNYSVSFRRTAFLFAAVVLLPAFLITAVTVNAQQKSLYQRLGGYDALAGVTDDFIGRLASDKDIGRFFVGASDNSKKRIRQLVLDQLCQATGGPCIYIGRDMKTTHAGLKITEKDWDISVKHLTATLDKFKVPKKEKGEVLAAISGLKKDIIEQ